MKINISIEINITTFTADDIIKTLTIIKLIIEIIKSINGG